MPSAAKSAPRALGERPEPLPERRRAGGRCASMSPDSAPDVDYCGLSWPAVKITERCVLYTARRS